LNLADDQDPDTGLLTEAGFLAAVAAKMRTHKSDRGAFALAVLSIQFDHLPGLRRERGTDFSRTDFGRQLIQATAERLIGCIRTHDLAARAHGTHFHVLLEPLNNPEVAASIAHKICAILRRPFAIQGHVVNTSACVGISLFPNDGADAATLVTRADRALHHARSAGDRFQFDDHSLEAALGYAVELDDNPRDALHRGEFELYYQPRIHLTRGTTVSAEALIRWQHPTRGTVSPNDFIPLAESTGLIHEIGVWVLEQACRQAAEWIATKHMPVRVSVNVSGRQLDDPDFPEVVGNALARAGLPSELLELEITESAIMRHPDDVADTLRRIRATGVSIALDDFGTGYSSLAYLRRFPLDTLKLDRSFVLDLADMRENIVLLRSIVQLAHGLGLRVVAEGVETAAQFDIVRSQGCDEIQGFLISRPLPVADFEHAFLPGNHRPIGNGKHLRAIRP
jgi:diguanylate cyclase (GGDEF)-like protein